LRTASKKKLDLFVLLLSGITYYLWKEVEEGSADRKEKEENRKNILEPGIGPENNV
jgi:hypothetical protein